jgi:hypothetical protein
LEGVEGGELPRLNDDEWKEMLKAENVSELHPYWIFDIYGEIEPLIFPEFGAFSLIIVFTFSTLITITTLKFIKKIPNRHKPHR